MFRRRSVEARQRGPAAPGPMQADIGQFRWRGRLVHSQVAIVVRFAQGERRLGGRLPPPGCPGAAVGFFNFYVLQVEVGTDGFGHGSDGEPPG